jgi:hypothetical protein
MDQARARFEQYLKRRFGQSSTLKHYISDLNIFIDSVDNKAPETVTEEDAVQNNYVSLGGHCGGRLAGG